MRQRRLEERHVTKSRESNLRRRIASAVAVAGVAITAFALLGGAGLAQSAIGLAQYQYGKKVTICHKGKKTVRVSVRAWPAHKRHGDTEGPCIRAAEKKHPKHESRAEPAKHDGAKEHGKAREASEDASGDRSDDDSGHGKGKGKNSGKGNGKR